jgi:hypothetical protein
MRAKPQSATGRTVGVLAFITLVMLGAGGCGNYCEELGDGWEESDGGDGSPNQCYNRDTEEFTPSPEPK